MELCEIALENRIFFFFKSLLSCSIKRFEFYMMICIIDRLIFHVFSEKFLVSK